MGSVLSPEKRTDLLIQMAKDISKVAGAVESHEARIQTQEKRWFTVLFVGVGSLISAGVTLAFTFAGSF